MFNTVSVNVISILLSELVIVLFFVVLFFCWLPVTLCMQHFSFLDARFEKDYYDIIDSTALIQSLALCIHFTKSIIDILHSFHHQTMYYYLPSIFQMLVCRNFLLVHDTVIASLHMICLDQVPDWSGTSPCLDLPGWTTCSEIFIALDEYFKHMALNGANVRVCTDGATNMSGHRSGVVAK